MVRRAAEKDDVLAKMTAPRWKIRRRVAIFAGAS